MKDYFLNKKILISKEDIRLVDVPRWEEFQTNKIYEFAIND